VPEPKLNWASAEVEDGSLTVALEGEITSGWKESFNITLRLLGGGDWGEVKLQPRKGTIRVSAVEPGSEERLRHRLEGVVEQANASARTPEPEPEAEPEDAADPEDAEGKGDGDDARMTERFRAFDSDTEAEPRAS
jgi:hypothetical protein